MKQTYEESIVDIIHAIHDLEQLSPSEILAIIDVASNYDVNTKPYYVLYYRFERVLEKYKDIQNVIITEHNHNVSVSYIEKVNNNEIQNNEK